MCNTTDSGPCECKPLPQADPFMLPLRIRTHLGVEAGGSVRIHWNPDKTVLLTAAPVEKET